MPGDVTAVLGAPGSGKTSVAATLRSRLPHHVVLDWDAFMEPAGALAGRDVRRLPELWPAYRQLLRSVLEAVSAAPVVMLGVSTPDEVAGWPIDAWLLLDCDDGERRRRLRGRSTPVEIEAAVADAAAYRSLGLRRIDTTDRAVEEVADEIAGAVARH
jgi:broad-specificity NMP kinase